MADWIYCGTANAVDAARTQSLLQTHAAIWCPPDNLYKLSKAGAIPRSNERLWLVWRSRAGVQTVSLLGGGRIWDASCPQNTPPLLWTDREFKGLLDAAKALGYQGKEATCFLRLTCVILPEQIRRIRGLGDIESGLNVASDKQQEILMENLQIP